MNFLYEANWDNKYLLNKFFSVNTSYKDKIFLLRQYKLLKHPFKNHLQKSFADIKNSK